MTRAALSVASALLACACRTVSPAFLPLPADDPRPARLIASWAAEAHARRALRGVARLAVDSANGAVHIRSSQVLVVERPDRLRVEVRGFLDQTLAVIVTDGESYQVFRAQDRSFESGSVDPDLLWREAYLALTPEEAIGLLLGAPPGTDAAPPLRAFSREDGAIRLELADAGGAPRLQLAFDAAGRLRRVENLGSGGRSWQAAYSDYAPVGGAPVAHTITLDVEPGGSHAEISLRNVELNPELAPGLFRLRGVAGSGG